MAIQKLKLGREWEIGERIGGGGFGQVYAVTSNDVEPAVAKLVPKVPGASRELLFVDLAGVRNVVPIIDSGETEDSWVLVMPRAERSLRQFLDGAVGPLSVSEAIPVLLDVTTALTDLDGKIVHRDLKPDNVLYLNGNWCLADFGISRYADATTAPDTQKFALSPPYAAPERWRAERATSATDVYSLGVVAFELLSNSLPFSGREQHDFREQHLHASPPILSNVPPELAALVSECLYKPPGARPSATNVRARLERLSGGAVQSPGLSRLRKANLSEVQRRGEDARRASEQLSERQRREELGAAATHWLEQLWATLLDLVTEAASTTEVGAREAHLDQARLSFTQPRMVADNPWSGWEPPAFDVICFASISVRIPPNRNAYEGRSHSLWYCDAQETGRYQWFETAFMISPLVNRRSRLNPYAMDPSEEAAKALWNGVAEYEVAWPFTPLDANTANDFIDRWAGWFADASEGRLEHPSTMPERRPEGSWRRT